MFEHLKVSHKLGLGFGIMIVLIIISSISGYSGISALQRNIFIIGSEETPIIDAANNMKVSLMNGRNAMQEFKGASTVVFKQASAQELASLINIFKQSLLDFDQSADAILQGGTLNSGLKVYATANTELADEVKRADQIHNQQFQPAAKAMIEAGQQLVLLYEQQNQSKTKLQQAFERVMLEVEAVILLQIEQRTVGALAGYIDTTLELKVQIQQSHLNLSAIMSLNQQSQFPSLLQSYQSTLESFENIVQSLLEGGIVAGKWVSSLTNETSREHIKKLNVAHQKYQQAAKQLIELQQELIKTSLLAEHTMEKLEQSGEQATLSLTKVEAMSKDEMQAVLNTADDDSEIAFLTLAITAIISVACGLLLGWATSRSITKPLGGEPAQMQKMAQEIAAGNLKKPVVTSGKTQGAYKAMLEMSHTLRELIGEISTSSDMLSTAAQQTATISEQTQSGVNSQYQETEQVATAINQMATTIHDVARNASETARATGLANDETDKGYATVQQTITAINSVATKIENTATVIQDLEKSSDGIASVLDVIRGIADQTNLLALNAAIEAARAGEQGRGFSVVADEVRTLAQRTQSSTADIQSMIEVLQTNAHNAVSEMQESIVQANESVEQAGKAGDALTSIQQAIGHINDMNSQVASAAEEQSVVAEQISKSITNISSIGEQTAGGAKSTAAASVGIATMASELRQKIAVFSV